MGVQPESPPNTATYPSTVYQWETNDPVLGGAGGIANNPILALCNRTQFLLNKLNGLNIGIDIQAYDPDLAAIAALTGTGLVRRTGNGTAALVSTWVDNSIAQGRLTLSSGNATPTADLTAQSTLYYTPYDGNAIALWNGTEWVLYAFSERSLSLSGLAANTNHDIFIWDNSGTLTLQAVAWTNDTTRASAISQRNGVRVKTSDDRRYLGTIRTTGTIGQSEDSAIRRFIWNANNRVPRKAYSYSNAPHTYSSTSWRAWNGGITPRIEVVVGIPGENLVSASGGLAVSNGDGYVSIGVNSTTTPGADFNGSSQLAQSANSANINCFLTHIPSGYTYYQLLEAIDTGASTNFQDAYIGGIIFA